MSTVPTKIVMKGTAQISLHDRFSQLPPPSPSSMVSDKQHNGHHRNDDDGTFVNQKLARNMIDRPNVMRALSSHGYEHPRPRNHNNYSSRKLPAHARLGVYAFPMKRRAYSLFPYHRRARFGNHYTRSTRYAYPTNRYYLTTLNGGNEWRTPSLRRGVGLFRGRRGLGGRGRGGTYQSSKPHMTKDELDRQIDEYMQKSTIKLDSDMDSYMKSYQLTA